MVALASPTHDLPNYCGRRWQTTQPVITLVRRGDCWMYGEYVDMGVTLEFCGWAGLDRAEPMASFTSDDLPGLIVFLPPSKLGQWCRELTRQESDPVKVRIVGGGCDSECG